GRAVAGSARRHGDRAARHAARPLSGDAAHRAHLELRQRAPRPCPDLPGTARARGRRRRRSRRRHRRDADSRDRPLLRAQRRRDRGDRRALLAGRRRMIRARKRFGQHFLEPAWVDKVVRAIDPRPDETFIEIGPGRGALTRPLAARARAVVAYEIDRDLAAALRAEAVPNVRVIESDFLTVDARSRLVRESPGPLAIRVAGNLPYNVASPILFKIAEHYAAGTPIVDATLMLQREVADRLVSPSGT